MLSGHHFYHHSCKFRQNPACTYFIFWNYNYSEHKQIIEQIDVHVYMIVPDQRNIIASIKPLKVPIKSKFFFQVCSTHNICVFTHIKGDRFDSIYMASICISTPQNLHHAHTHTDTHAHIRTHTHTNTPVVFFQTAALLL